MIVPVIDKQRACEELLSFKSGIPLGKIRSGNLTDEEFNSLEAIATDLCDLPLYLQEIGVSN